MLKVAQVLPFEALRRLAAQIFVAFGVAALALAPAFAAELVTPLLANAPSALVKAAVTKRQSDDRTVRRYRVVEVDLAALDAKSTKASHSISLELFDGRTIIIDRSHIESRSSLSWTWYGHIRGFPTTEAIFTVVDGYVTAHFALLDDTLQSKGTFQLHSVGDHLYALRELDYGGQDEEPSHRHAPPQLGGPDAVSPASDPASLIDVMVVYSNQTAAAAGASIGSQVQAAVDYTNQIYANSAVTQRLRLVHYEQASYDEHTDAGSDVFSTALDDMTYASSTLAALPALRNTYGADLVAMLIEDGTYCGIAWVGPYQAYGFAVINRGCATGNSSFAHELGHNMGALHDPYVDPDTSPFTYGHGYINLTGRFRTVMAYDNQCNASGFSCTRVPYFSNPSLTYNGYPLGTVQADPQPTSNMARVLNETAGTVANFRQSVSGCTYSASPTAVSAAAAGVSGSITITAAASCAWTAASNAAWVTITSGTSGTANGATGYTVSANTGAARNGTLTVAGQTITVNQATGCTYNLGTSSANATAGGASGSVSVVAGTGCAWSAVSNAVWISITSGASGTGAASVAYSVAANSGATRSATLTIAGQTFTINQAAATAYSLSPLALDFTGVATGTTSGMLTATLANSGGTNLSLSSLTPGGSNAGDFVRSGTCAVGLVLGSGQSCTIAYTFSPAAAGARSASLAVATSLGTSMLTLSGYGQSLLSDLEFTPLAPCRLVDTRGAAPLGARASAVFSATDTVRIGQAGGSAPGCGIPAYAQALVLTLTSVAPPLAGNLVAYAAGTPVPLASSLNFAGGGIVANTTVVAITAGAGDNFAVYNNSDGGATVVVDVVGYFAQNAASDCTKVSQAQSVGGLASAAVAASCAAGYRATGGGCSSTGSVGWTDRRPLANLAGFSCGVKNATSSAVTVTSDALCCRIAGR